MTRTAELARSELPETLVGWLAMNAAHRGGRAAFQFKHDGIWHVSTWSAVYRTVRAFSLGLSDLGLKRGDRLAIVGGNRPRIYMTMMAAQAIGVIPVPMSDDALADELGELLVHAGARSAVVQNQEQADKLLAITDRLPDSFIIVYDQSRGMRDYDARWFRSFDSVQSIGQHALGDLAKAGRLDEEMRIVKGADICIILYTPGTGGSPKGVVLAHEHCVTMALDAATSDQLSENERVLAYLPPACAIDYYFIYCQALVAGFCIFCPESPETVEQNLREIGPTFHVAPPYVLKSLFIRTVTRMWSAGFVARWLYDHFMTRACASRKAGRPQSASALGRLHHCVGDILVFAPLKNMLGLSCIRTMYTTGDPISQDLLWFYRSLGIDLRQSYGLTEGFFLVVDRHDRAVCTDSIGQANANVQLRICDKGEVQFKSPGMFAAYWNDDEGSSAAFTTDGFVRTGDAGILDANGQLRILGGIEDIGECADGSILRPKYVESKLKQSCTIKEAVVFGYGRKFAGCLIVIDSVWVGAWAERNKITYSSYQELARNLDVAALIRCEVAKTNELLANDPLTKDIELRRFLILHKELDADDGELTRMQKVRRSFIARRYGSLVDALFRDETDVDVLTDAILAGGKQVAETDRVKIHGVDGQHAVEQAAER
jgi:long-chain acyl-CoA synthetase